MMQESSRACTKSTHSTHKSRAGAVPRRHCHAAGRGGGAGRAGARELCRRGKCAFVGAWVRACVLAAAPRLLCDLALKPTHARAHAHVHTHTHCAWQVGGNSDCRRAGVNVANACARALAPGLDAAGSAGCVQLLQLQCPWLVQQHGHHCTARLLRLAEPLRAVALAPCRTGGRRAALLPRSLWAAAWPAAGEHSAPCPLVSFREEEGGS